MTRKISVLVIWFFVLIVSFLYVYAIGDNKIPANNFYYVSKNNWQVYISNIRDNIRLVNIKTNTKKINNGDLIFYNGEKLVRIIWDNNIKLINDKTTFFDDINIFIQSLDNNKIQELIKIYNNEPIRNYLIENILNKIGWQENIIKEKEKKQYFYNNSWRRLNMDGRIIMREDWWANETWWTPEKYMASCPSWNCWWWQTSARYKRVQENYKNNFEQIDNDNMLKIQNSFTKEYQEYIPVEQIFIHHTAWNLPMSKKEGISTIKWIYSYHALTLWWGDVWYHYLIDWAGNIYEWNRWWMYSVWTHIYWHNRWTVWISLMGNSKYTEKQLKSLEDLVMYLAKEYKLDLSSEVNVRKPELDWYEKWFVIWAHKEVDNDKPTDPNINMNTFRNKFLYNSDYNFTE